MKGSILKNYSYKNILCFGDNIHKIHPLAGQGLNMTIRDIKILSKLIDERIEFGMSLDKSILNNFEYKTKHLKNFESSKRKSDRSICTRTYFRGNRILHCLNSLQ